MGDLLGEPVKGDYQSVLEHGNRHRVCSAPAVRCRDEQGDNASQNDELHNQHVRDGYKYRLHCRGGPITDTKRRGTICHQKCTKKM